MTSPTGKRSNVGMIYGLIGGIACIIFSLCLYLAGPESFTNMGVGLGMYAVIITIAVLAGLAQKKQNGGYIDFGTALKTAFVTFAIAFLLQTLFNFVLLNYINPGFRDELTRVSMEKMERMMKSWNVPESEIEKGMERMANQNSYSFGNVILGYGMMCIISCIVSLIIAAIIKKNRPPFENAFKDSQ